MSLSDSYRRRLKLFSPLSQVLRDTLPVCPSILICLRHLLSRVLLSFPAFPTRASELPHVPTFRVEGVPFTSSPEKSYVSFVFLRDIICHLSLEVFAGTVITSPHPYLARFSASVNARVLHVPNCNSTIGFYSLDCGPPEGKTISAFPALIAVKHMAGNTDATTDGTVSKQKTKPWPIYLTATISFLSIRMVSHSARHTLTHHTKGHTHMEQGQV